MKKLMILALMAIATTAYAQDDAFKAFKKAKTAAEITNILKTNEANFTAAQNAQAYAKLTDLAFAVANKEYQTMATNQAKVQMGGKPDPVDTLAMYNSLREAMRYALVCDKYDQQPNEKGKVAPKYRKTNSDRLFNMRAFLVNAGQDSKDVAYALDCYELYVNSAKSPLFAENIAKQPDEYLYDVARVAAYQASQINQMDKAYALLDVMAEKPELTKEAVGYKLYFAEQGITTHEDSLKCVATLEQLYVKHHDNSDVFGKLATWYANVGNKAAHDKLIEDRIAANPKDYTALVLKGQDAMNSGKHAEAIPTFESAIAADPNHDLTALIYTYLGYCTTNLANDAPTAPEQNKLLEKATAYLEKAREIDPKQERANWSYPLYNCYYHLYGENDSRVKELESMIK